MYVEPIIIPPGQLFKLFKSPTTIHSRRFCLFNRLSNFLWPWNKPHLLFWFRLLTDGPVSYYQINAWLLPKLWTWCDLIQLLYIYLFFGEQTRLAVPQVVERIGSISSFPAIVLRHALYVNRPSCTTKPWSFLLYPKIPHGWFLELDEGAGTVLLFFQPAATVTDLKQTRENMQVFFDYIPFEMPLTKLEFSDGSLERQWHP